MKEQTIAYGYKYDEVNEVYKVWRQDGESLDSFIPDGLFQQITMQEVFNTGEMLIICDVQKSKHFSTSGKVGFIDLKDRKYSKTDIDKIFAEENIEIIDNDGYSKTINPTQTEKPKVLTKILNRFKRK